MARCYNSYNRTYYYCNSYNRWGNWGRWVLLGVIVAAAILLVLLFSCITARRRRRAGRKPFYGTGWAAPGTYNAPTQPPSMQQSAFNNNTAYKTNTQQQTYGNNPYDSNGQSYGQNAYGGQNAEYYGGNSNAQTGAYQPPSYPPPAQTRN